jgi:glucose/arabinose dehydrogenase
VVLSARDKRPRRGCTAQMNCRRFNNALPPKSTRDDVTEPIKALIPTIHIAPARGWPAGGKPIPAYGISVNAFATGLDHPRWLHVLHNGNVLVAETNAPPRPEDEKGIKGLVARIVRRQGRASRAQIGSRCCAPRPRRDGDEVGVPQRSQLAIRHGADRQRPLHR